MPARQREHGVGMRQGRRGNWTRPLGIFLTILGGFSACQAEQPTAEAVRGFDSYVQGVEGRLDRQNGVTLGQNKRRVRTGEVVIEHLTPEPAPDSPGAMLHHWRATAFVAGRKAVEFEKLLRNFSGYPQVFAPQVIQAHVLAGDGDHATVVYARTAKTCHHRGDGYHL